MKLGNPSVLGSKAPKYENLRWHSYGTTFPTNLLDFHNVKTWNDTDICGTTFPTNPAGLHSRKRNFQLLGSNLESKCKVHEEVFQAPCYWDPNPNINPRLVSPYCFALFDADSKVKLSLQYSKIEIENDPNFFFTLSTYNVVTSSWPCFRTMDLWQPCT